MNAAAYPAAGRAKCPDSVAAMTTLPDGTRVRTTETVEPDGSKKVVKETTDTRGVTTVVTTRVPAATRRSSGTAQPEILGTDVSTITRDDGTRVVTTTYHYSDGSYQVDTEECFEPEASHPEEGAQRASLPPQWQPPPVDLRNSLPVPSAAQGASVPPQWQPSSLPAPMFHSPVVQEAPFQDECRGTDLRGPNSCYDNVQVGGATAPREPGGSQFPHHSEQIFPMPGVNLGVHPFQADQEMVDQRMETGRISDAPEHFYSVAPAKPSGGSPASGVQQSLSEQGADLKVSNVADARSSPLQGKRRLYIVLGLSLLAVIGLAVGLSVALTKGDDDVSTTTTTMTPKTPMPPKPTPTPTTPRKKVITEIIQTISGNKALDISTPQGQALNWLVSDDPMQLDPLTAESESIIQRYVVALMYFAWGGSDWIRRDGFLSDTSECNWFGVTCEESKVTELDFQGDQVIDGNNMEGAFIDEIVHLRQLAKLGLGWNRLHGHLPADIGSLTKLEELYLWVNELTGPIPAGIGSLSFLNVIGLANNSLSETIPASLGELKYLERLYLEYNKLTGVIPSSLGNLAFLQKLWLSSNKLSGSLPENLLSLSNLELLVAYGNELTGSLPTGVGDLTKLEVLTLGGNRLVGNIPESITKLGKMTNLELAANRFHGTIPAGIGNLTMLEFLYLHENLLNGPIPPLHLLANLEKLYLHDNNLSGTLSPRLGDLTNLVELVVADNKLNGPIPSSLGNLNKLEGLYLHENDFSGSVPDAVCGLFDRGALEELFADCDVSARKVQCDCCTRCL